MSPDQPQKYCTTGHFRRFVDNHTHSVENRIVSVSQPFVRPIVRGKVGKPVKFGMKFGISFSDGWTRLEYAAAMRKFDG